MAYIKIKLDAALMDGHNVTFKAPCDCTAVEGLKVCYIENNSLQEKIFAMKDTHGNALAGLGNLFAEGAYIHAILDSVNLIAYLQNAATNGYLEGKLSAAEATIAEDHAAIEQLVKNQIPEEYLQACVDDYISNNQSGIATKTDLENLNISISDDVYNITKASESVNLFTKQNAFHWYRSTDGTIKESIKTLTFVVPFAGSEYSILNPFFGYSNNVYLRFLNGKPKIGDNLTEYQISSVKLTQEYQIRQVAEGTKYIWVTVRDETIDNTYTEEEVFNKCMLLKGAYKREYVSPINMTVTKDSLNDDLANILNSIYDGAPTVYTTNDCSVVSPSFIGNPSLMLTQTTYKKIIELFDSLNLGMVKSIIGYATTTDGEEDISRPIYCYSLRNSLENGKGFYSNGRKMLVVAGQHGNEKNGVFGLYKILKEYADCTNIYLSDILDGLELDIIPVLNPYGFDNNTRDNARGVNINRNFDYFWEGYAGTDKGGAKESEHETKAFIRFINEHINDYYCLADIHCSTRYQGTEQLLAQMFANSVTLRQHFSTQISRCNRKWKKKYNLDIMELQIGCETDRNNAINKNGGLTGEIGEIPQLAGWFTQITNRFACEIEVPKHRTTYVGTTESGNDVVNGYKYLWYGYPTPQISMDVIAATLASCSKTMEALYATEINNEPVQGDEAE